MLQIVPLPCGSPLPVVCGSGIRLENCELRPRLHDHAFLRVLSRLFTVQVCVLPTHLLCFAAVA